MSAPSFRDLETALRAAVKAAAPGVVTLRFEAASGVWVADIRDLDQMLAEGGSAEITIDISAMARIMESELS